MTAPESEVTLAALAERFDGLTDLFKRRLLDDRSKQFVIEDLQERLTRAEKAALAIALKPIVDGLALVIERVRAMNPDDDLHVIDELEYLLESVVGVTPIQANAGDRVDRLRHEVASASGDGTELLVADLVRAGYEKDGVVLRPATITAVRAADVSAPTTESDDDDECRDTR